MLYESHCRVLFLKTHSEAYLPDVNLMNKYLKR